MILAAAWQFSMLGLPARLALPDALWFIAALLLAALLWARMLWTRAKAMERTIPERLLSRVAPRAGAGRELWSGSATILGLALLSIAAAQPQCGTHTTQARRYGMDVVIAIDASNSMSARDVKPSRLERAKLELSGLIDRLHGDRVGIVVFAGDAFVQCPLTSDYAAAKLFLRAVDPKGLPQQGTALAAALKVAGTLFEGGQRGDSGRALVLLTDGEDHQGDVDAETDKLVEAGVRIFSVGVGSRTGEPIPLFAPDGSIAGYKKDRAGNTVMTRLNEEALQKIASKAKGRYVNSSGGDLGVGEVVEELSRMNKAEYESHLTVQFEERFESFAWPGLVLLVIGAVLGEGRFWRRREAA